MKFLIFQSLIFGKRIIHSHPGQKRAKKDLTKPFIDLLLINTIIPLKFMYLKSIDKLNETEIIDIVDGIKTRKKQYYR